MACEEWRADLDLYLDGELRGSAPELWLHTANCPACAGEVLERVQLKRSVQMAGARYTASAELRNKITKGIAVRVRREE